MQPSANRCLPVVRTGCPVGTSQMHCWATCVGAGGGGREYGDTLSFLGFTPCTWGNAMGKMNQLP